MTRKQTILEKFFGIDCRSLALFRIGLALVVLYDLMVRACDLNVFYTDNGVLPRVAMIGRSLESWIFSIHLMSGNTLIVAMLFIVQGLCAIGLLFGFKTRWMTFFTWIFLASLQRRNPYVFGGADNYLRMMLFWSMFLPLGLRYSIDNALKTSPLKRPHQILSFGTAAILLQTVFVYVFTALHKWPGELWQNGSAMYYVFHINLYARELGEWLLMYPLLLKGLTHFVLWFELVGPLLLFFPIFTIQIRIFGIFAFFLLQLGFASLLYIKLFPAISFVAMFLFIPATVWDHWFTPISRNILNRFKLNDRIPRRLFENILLFIKSKISGLSQSPGATPRKTSLLANIMAAFFLVFTFFWLLSNLPDLKFNMPKPLQNVGRLIYIDQTWKMFAPGPARMGGWMVAPGTLANGTQVDLSRDGLPVSWDEPSKRALIKNERWRKYLVQFVLTKNKWVVKHYAQYLCRSWNSEHFGNQRLQSLNINTMVRITKPDGKSGNYKKRTLFRHKCRVK